MRFWDVLAWNVNWIREGRSVGPEICVRETWVLVVFAGFKLKILERVFYDLLLQKMQKTQSEDFGRSR